jgi:hypothetical protein
MKLKTAETLLPCHCEGVANDSRVEKAARVAVGDPVLRERLQQQRAWDQQMSGVISSIHAPKGLRRRITTAVGAGSGSRKNVFRYLAQPAVLAVLVGLSVIVGLMIYFELERREEFRGREAAARMIEVTNGMSGLELEPMDTEVGRLGDWFYMRGFEGFAVPPEFSSLPVVGSRVFKVDGNPVAQLAVETNHSPIIYVFRPADFRMQLVDGADWRLFDHVGWIAALRRQGDTCTMIAFRGTKPQMRELLQTLKTKTPKS